MQRHVSEDLFNADDELDFLYSSTRNNVDEENDFIAATDSGEELDSMPNAQEFTCSPVVFDNDDNFMDWEDGGEDGQKTNKRNDNDANANANAVREYEEDECEEDEAIVNKVMPVGRHVSVARLPDNRTELTNNTYDISNMTRDTLLRRCQKR